jgi:hypothetical protein
VITDSATATRGFSEDFTTADSETTSKGFGKIVEKKKKNKTKH